MKTINTTPSRKRYTRTSYIVSTISENDMNINGVFFSKREAEKEIKNLAIKFTYDFLAVERENAGDTKYIARLDKFLSVLRVTPSTNAMTVFNNFASGNFFNTEYSITKTQTYFRGTRNN